MVFELSILALVAVGLAFLWLRKPRGRPPRAATPRPPAASRPVPAAPVAVPETPAGDPATEPRELPEALERLDLLSTAALDADGRQRLLSVCAAMPEPHPIQTRMATGLDAPEELMEAVASDAGLTASILKTVNSAAFALSTPITSVQHAVTYLGVSVVKGLVAQAVVARAMPEGTPQQEAALARIWRSACNASALAQMFGQELGLQRPSVLATKSLFFNLGDVALVLAVEEAAEWYSEGVSIVDRIDAQQRRCGLNTALVGAELARSWNLPADLVDAIETGFLPLCTPPAAHPMEGDERRSNVLVYLAGRIGDRVTYGGLRDIADLPLVGSAAPGLFYLADHLEAAGLGRALQLTGDPAFRRKANRLIETLAG
jgi:hypothetical protein